MSTTDRQLCAVCALCIRPGLLMCQKHWRLVPLKQQQAVLVAYGHWMRHKGDLRSAAPLIAAYREARDAAVASARKADPSHPSHPATGELL